MPILHAGAPLGLGDDVKDFPQLLNAVVRKVDLHGNGIHKTAKEKLDGVPATVSFVHILEGYRIATGLGIVRCQGSKDMVNSVE